MNHCTIVKAVSTTIKCATVWRDQVAADAERTRILETLDYWVVRFNIEGVLS
jgi:hypothetical protein